MPPPPPTDADVDFDSITDKSVTISWCWGGEDEGDEGGMGDFSSSSSSSSSSSVFKDVRFRVEIDGGSSAEGGGGGGGGGGGVGVQWKEASVETGRSCVIRRLRPSTTYRVRIRTLCKTGGSPFTVPITVTTEEADVDYAAIEAEQVRMQFNNSNWSLPLVLLLLHLGTHLISYLLNAIAQTYTRTYTRINTPLNNPLTPLPVSALFQNALLLQRKNAVKKVNKVEDEVWCVVCGVWCVL